MSRFIISLLLLEARCLTLTGNARNCLLTLDYSMCSNVHLPILRAYTYPINITSIYGIHFNNNNLTGIEPDAFRGTPRLMYILVTHNLIRRLPTPLFADLKDLIHIDLTGNLIEVLQADVFRFQNNLKFLFLGGNRISALDSTVLKPLVGLEALDLSYNPFRCDCDLRETVQWCADKGFDSKAACRNGTLWRSLDAAELCMEESTTQSTTHSAEIRGTETVGLHDHLILLSCGSLLVFLVCMATSVYFVWRYRQRRHDNERLEIEDCGSEFVTARRQQATPECRVSRKPSETESLYSNPCSLVQGQKEELPNLVAYAEPFHRGDSPPPVYAVPIDHTSYKARRENCLYATPCG